MMCFTTLPSTKQFLPNSTHDCLILPNTLAIIHLKTPLNFWCIWVSKTNLGFWGSSWFQKIIEEQIHWNYQNWLKPELRKSISLFPTNFRQQGIVTALLYSCTAIQSACTGDRKTCTFGACQWMDLSDSKAFLHHFAQRTYFYVIDVHLW